MNGFAKGETVQKKLGILVLFAAGSLSAASTATVPVTFHKDVEAILQKRCQACHRPGEAAPMSFLTYQDVRPWAKAIRSAVLLKKMPPWSADPAYGKFLNDRSLTAGEIDTVKTWVDQGAMEGNAKDAPAPLQFTDGWSIGTPDLIVEMPKAFEVPATGVIPYQYIVVPTGLTEDKWVVAAEIRPGNRRTMHHSIAFALAPGTKSFMGSKPGDFLDAIAIQKAQQRKPGAPEPNQFDSGINAEAVQTYAPGGVPTQFEPGQARLVKAGSNIMFQLHYTPNGKPFSDRTRLGMIFAKQAPTERVKMVNVQNFAFSIPPNVDDYPIEARARVTHDFTIISMLPHMHLRGKDFEYRATYPTGESEILLRVPRWDFNWQITYYLEKPKLIPKGTIIECVGHFDNTPNNPFNPDASAEVVYGEQTFNEMMGGIMDIALDPKLGSFELFESVPPQPKTQAQRH